MESPDSDSPVKAAGAAAAAPGRGPGQPRAWPQLHHVHEGIANVIGDRIFLPSRWQPSNDAHGGHAALRLTGGSHSKPHEAGKCVLSVRPRGVETRFALVDDL